MSGSVFFPSSSGGDGSPLFGGPNTNFRSGSSPFWNSKGPFSATKYSSDGERPNPGEGRLFDPPSPFSPADANTGSGGYSGYSGWREKSSDGREGSVSPSPSLLYRDLSGTPVGQSAASNGRPDLATAAAATALWQNGSPGTRLPAPPLATLDDLNGYFSETAPSPLQAGLGSPADFTEHGAFGSPSIRDAGFGYGGQQNDTLSAGVPPSIRSWESPSAAQSWPHKGFSSPISKDNSPEIRGTMFGQRSLLSVTPPSNVVEPPQSSQGDTNSADHWITVYGFTAEQTNMVLREFEKCGPMVDHIYGPAGANWIHIRYQVSDECRLRGRKLKISFSCLKTLRLCMSPYNAQRALSKNGLQLSSSLIIGVKPIDQSQLDSVRGKVPTLHETRSIVTDSNATGGGLGLASARPYLLKNPGSETLSMHPTKSKFSRFTDLLFGS